MIETHCAIFFIYYFINLLIGQWDNPEAQNDQHNTNGIRDLIQVQKVHDWASKKRLSACSNLGSWMSAFNNSEQNMISKEYI